MDKYLIDNHKLYWHLDRVVEWQKSRIVTPIYVEVSPVGFCNNRCIFCGIDFAMDHKSQLDSTILCKRFREMGSLGVRSIMFAGEGEPLLHKDLKLLIKTAKEAGIDVSLTTNGNIGDYSLWKDILPYITWIRFSVDAGTPEVYSKIHCVHESWFEKTTNSIKDAVKVKKDLNLKTTIGVQFLIIDENLNDIDSAIRLFSGIGIDYLSLKPYSMHPKMTKKKNVIYTRKVLERVQKIIDKYNKIEMNIIFRKSAMDKYMNGEKLFNHCKALPFWGYITSQGDFYTCSVFINDKRFNSGNIYEQDMQNILFGDMRKNSIAYGEKDLNIKDECRVNCRMARINEFLEFIDSKTEHVNFI